MVLQVPPVLHKDITVLQPYSPRNHKLNITQQIKLLVLFVHVIHSNTIIMERVGMFICTPVKGEGLKEPASSVEIHTVKTKVC